MTSPNPDQSAVPSKYDNSHFLGMIQNNGEIIAICDVSHHDGGRSPIGSLAPCRNAAFRPDPKPATLAWMLQLTF